MTPEEIELFTVPKEKPQRQWQNLIHRRCPNCNERFEDSGQYFKCPTIREDDGRPCFFIEKLKAAGYLLNEEHPANKCLTDDERMHIEQSVYGALGLDMQ